MRTWRVTFTDAENPAVGYVYEADAHPARTGRTVAHQLWLWHCQHDGAEIDMLNPVVEDLGVGAATAA